MLDITAAHRAYLSRQTHSRPSRRTRTAQRFAARQTSSRCQTCIAPRGRAHDMSADVGSFAEAAKNARLHALCRRPMRLIPAFPLSSGSRLRLHMRRKFFRQSSRTCGRQREGARAVQCWRPASIDGRRRRPPVRWPPFGPGTAAGGVSTDGGLQALQRHHASVTRPCERPEPVRRRTDIAQHSTKPAWTQSLLCLAGDFLALSIPLGGIRRLLMSALTKLYGLPFMAAGCVPFCDLQVEE
jgi:hypothetical protein